MQGTPHGPRKDAFNLFYVYDTQMLLNCLYLLIFYLYCDSGGVLLCVFK